MTNLVPLSRLNRQTIAMAPHLKEAVRSLWRNKLSKVTSAVSSSHQQISIPARDLSKDVLWTTENWWPLDGWTRSRRRFQLLMLKMLRLWIISGLTREDRPLQSTLNPAISPWWRRINPLETTSLRVRITWELSQRIVRAWSAWSKSCTELRSTAKKHSTSLCVSQIDILLPWHRRAKWLPTWFSLEQLVCCLLPSWTSTWTHASRWWSTNSLTSYASK